MIDRPVPPSPFRKLTPDEVAEMLTRPVYVYRLYSETDELLYIGQTAHPKRRVDAHRAKARFGKDIARVALVKYPNRADAVAAEAEAILNEDPRWNVVGRKPPLSRLEVPLVDALIDIAWTTLMGIEDDLEQAEIDLARLANELGVTRAEAERVARAHGTREQWLNGEWAQLLRREYYEKSIADDPRMR
jgi:predicted GIY-YIG superfamily endonuclease